MSSVSPDTNDVQPRATAEAVRPQSVNLGDLIGDILNPTVESMAKAFGKAAVPFVVVLIGGCVVSLVYLTVPQLYKSTVGFVASVFFLTSFAGFVIYSYRTHKRQQKRR